jgi:dTMP kinase
VFITFEGPEGSGKTTQLARAADYLRAQGLTVLQTREPGGTPLADRIREVLLDAANTGLTPSAELLLYAAARAQHVVEKIKPALQRGEVVLCDRFADSTLAYQGYARGLDLNLVAQVNLFATGGLEPDLTLLFDLPVEVGLARAGARAKHLPDEQREDRFEREEIAFHQRLRDGYLHLAKAHAERFRVIDAAADVDAVWQRTRAILDAEVLRRRGR